MVICSVVQMVQEVCSPVLVSEALVCHLYVT